MLSEVVLVCFGVSGGARGLLCVTRNGGRACRAKLLKQLVALAVQCTETLVVLALCHHVKMAAQCAVQSCCWWLRELVAFAVQCSEAVVCFCCVPLTFGLTFTLVQSSNLMVSFALGTCAQSCC